MFIATVGWTGCMNSDFNEALINIIRTSYVSVYL